MEDNKNDVMEFDQEVIEEGFQPIHDEELLKLQKRKSIPKVVIQEFVGDMEDSDEDDEGNKKNEKTHIEIDTFGSLGVGKQKHIGLEEVSPLEGKNGQLKNEIDDDN